MRNLRAIRISNSTGIPQRSCENTVDTAGFNALLWYESNFNSALGDGLDPLGTPGGVEVVVAGASVVVAGEGLNGIHGD